MYKEHTVGVVVPAYNEEPFVYDVLATVPEFVDRVYVIDDASTDGTWDEIRRFAEEDDEGRVVPIQHEENRGVGGAIKTGYLRARDEEIDVTTVMGADGQMDPDQLSTVIDPIIEGEADYAKGNRLLDAEDRADMPTFRFVGNVILTYLTKISSGYWGIGDPQNGYTAISLEALEAVDIEEMYEFYGYCNDLLVKLNVAEMHVADVPVPGIYEDEESHIRYSTYIPNVSGMLLRNFLWRITLQYLPAGVYAPAALYGLSLFAGLAGVASVARSAVERDGESNGGVVRFALSAALVLVAMVADKRVNDHLDARYDREEDA
ncbi:glycosyltransferase family 2 protein [Halopelagius longus]|uniref:Glycosyl transferase family 2 n=1 Tax=Halopelagius longus TaxID=1236180 RepID=A0A1H1GII7_9EURY|nr:glycosyltransferase family 2 protein [Halopelagius longus]RDI69723.1 glycosyltransferase family 2 protein [Halopelagius longus]SDR12965.1 Glycosyl transferase family 2 [Halopelagius longus]